MCDHVIKTLSLTFGICHPFVGEFGLFLGDPASRHDEGESVHYDLRNTKHAFPLQYQASIVQYGKTRALRQYEVVYPRQRFCPTEARRV